MAGIKLTVTACFLLLALLFSFGFQPSEERPLNLADNNNNNGFSSLNTAETHPPPALNNNNRRNQKAGADNGGSAAVDADINDTTPGHSPGVGHSGGPSSAVGPKA
nr:transmembrane protein [Ipomoea batatas]